MRCSAQMAVADARSLVHYLYRTRGQSGLTATFLVLYFVFIILALSAYLRTFVTIQLDPGLVPLTRRRDAGGKGLGPRRARGRDAEANPWVPPDQDPDSPGLEAFYSKDVFVCEADGRPKWCSDCRQWKPDRAHHSSELERCVRKMDHLCPWVGGMVSETCRCSVGRALINLLLTPEPRSQPSISSSSSPFTPRAYAPSASPSAHTVSSSRLPWRPRSTAGS